MITTFQAVVRTTGHAPPDWKTPVAPEARHISIYAKTPLAFLPALIAQLEAAKQHSSFPTL
jgi:hypothetical protein